VPNYRGTQGAPTRVASTLGFSWETEAPNVCGGKTPLETLLLLFRSREQIGGGSLIGARLKESVVYSPSSENTVQVGTPINRVFFRGQKLKW